jgi:hypothetical protein
MSAEPVWHEPDEKNEAVTAAIDRAFSFLRAVHERPSLLDDMPERATVVLRDVAIEGHRFGLTAAQAADGGEWVARPFRYALTAGARLFNRPIAGGEGMVQDQIAIVETFRASGDTRDAALDALESKLRAAVAEAVQ